MRKQLIIYVSLALLLLAACVTDFTPEVKGVSGILVVDGTITDGESVFHLSRSVGITDDIRSADTITNAEVSVERSDGVFFKASQESKGAYRAINGALDPNLEYRLNISLDGKHYQSSFLKPIQSAEIDSLSFHKAGKGEPVTIHVSAHADKAQSPFYRWTFVENWELRAPRYTRHGYVNGVLTEFNINSPLNTYYCWGKDTSKVLLLESTEALAENRVEERKLTEIPCSHDKVSQLYHIEVFQTQLREEAYDYLRFMQDEIERTGGLFSIVMSAGDNGNIYNLSDPEEVVIGYIEVASTTRKSIFIANDTAKLYEDPHEYCPAYPAGPFAGQQFWLDYDKRLYTHETCVDCRSRYNASKNKPDWWPTDHQ